MGNTIDTIFSRRSVREFTKEDVSDDAITTILECGRWAPSGLNNQPWKFVVIREQDGIHKLADCTRYTKTVLSANVLIAVYFDNETSYNKTKDIQAIGAAVQNMLLACEELGLGAVWLGEILNQQEDVDFILKAPENAELMAVIAIGHPVEKARSSSRKDLEDIVFREKFGTKW
ncbi:nitroreductase [Methanohalophilus levihalophilus]|uniref:nitroreductase family protein n=1 Tax=Methanohalophilus levihalophilus TaxID=1431282 RepID=UPI00315B236A|nr:nitroreductase [Methanohalophilus levihalophilus]